MAGKHFINNHWIAGLGETLISTNPATGETIWEGFSANEDQINDAVFSARAAFLNWASLSFEERLVFLTRFTENLEKSRAKIAETISKEVGKPLWDANSEVGAMIHKLPIAIQAYQDRCKKLVYETENGLAITRHKPHGVVAVFGPFNFPGHLPNGHIIPALLAGNTVILKSSKLTPLVSEKIFECWESANLPPGVVNLIQGGGKGDEYLANHPDIDGLFFTGSFRVGQILSKAFSEKPEKILALEMGGNNPLVVCNIKNIEAAVYHTLQSAYITSGQRCTCARRLIVVRGSKEELFIQALTGAIKDLKVGVYTEKPEPFMGPLVSNDAAEKVFSEYEQLVKKGATPLVPMQKLKKSLPFLSPGLIDVSLVARKDEEIFGPLLQLIWVENFEAAVAEANNTSYGLAAGILCEDEDLYKQFLNQVQAGVINWNRATSGASSKLPFGGVKHSGNHRPSAYYSIDYCAYPVASLEEKELTLPKVLTPGVKI